MLWWSCNGLFWCCFHLRNDFFGAVVVGVTSAGLLEHKRTLNETFLFCEVFVTELTTACVLASFGILNSTMPK